LEHTEFVTSNVAWSLLCLLMSVSLLASLHFLSSQLLEAACDAISTMMGPIRLSNLDCVVVRVDLTNGTFVRIIQVSSSEFQVHVLALSSTVKLVPATIEGINGSLYVWGGTTRG